MILDNTYLANRQNRSWMLTFISSYALFFTHTDNYYLLKIWKQKNNAISNTF